MHVTIPLWLERGRERGKEEKMIEIQAARIVHSKPTCPLLYATGIPSICETVLFDHRSWGMCEIAKSYCVNAMHAGVYDSTMRSIQYF